MPLPIFSVVSTVLVLCGALLAPLSAADQRPNIVLIMTDNHGAWTLGCYGNPDIRTPHIDRLAREGTLFERAFASNPVCSPTRATFLTGLIPSQHGVHCFLRGGRLQVGPQARSTLEKITSVGEVLQQAGYACGLVGKWHLGDNLNKQEGFEDYWITMPHGGTSTFYNAQIIENGEVRKEPSYLTDFWTGHAEQFIKQQAEGDRPFFLFLAYNGPYALSRLLLREGQNRHAAYYADQELTSFPRQPTHNWQFSNRDYINNPVSIRRVATEVSGIDDGVGRVMQTLKEQGLADNTLVVFVADQGWVGGHGGFWGMGDHTRPLTAFDGMMRIPMIWHQPGSIQANQRSQLMVSNYDFMPTLLNHVGLGDRMPSQPASPGRDFSAQLVGEPTNDWTNEVFYEFEDLRCIRTDRWKYVQRAPNGPHELYDLQADPAEKTNLIDSRESTRARLQARLSEFFAQHAAAEYDLWQDGGSQTALFRGLDDPLVDPESAEPPPLEAGFTPVEFSVPEGYEVELVAGPPLVEHPMMGSFDDRGRLYLAESAGMNLRAAELEKQLPNYIRRLEDTDGDGRFDRSTIFADKMTLPQGALWHDGSLYVASPPNIWKLTDNDDDGVADSRQILVNQFGYTGNAASVHGCFLGPDGRIYWCDGRHGHEFSDEDGNITSQGDGSYIFSCNPDGSDVRWHAGGGMDNPVEVDFLDSGEMLGTVNIMYTAPREDCLVHWLHGGTYPHSQRVLGEFKKTGDLLGPVHKFGHVAVSGTTRYRSGVLDRSFRDNFFVTIFNTGKVLRVELQREGATFSATQHEFLTAANRDFKPTDVLEDADGSLLVIDTGGWFRQGCPTSQVARPELKGSIYRIRRKGMTTLVDPRGRRIDWREVSDSQLVRQYLNDTRFQVREYAIAECARRGNAIVPALAAEVKRADSRVRRNAIWALCRIGTLDATAAIVPGLKDPHESVQLAAIRSIGARLEQQAGRLIVMNVNVAASLNEALGSKSPPVRRAAATALGRIGKNVPGLLAALGQPIDRSEEHAIIYALISIQDVVQTQAGLESPDARIQRGALIALDQMDENRLQPEQVIQLARSQDPALREAAINVITNRPAWADVVTGLIRQLLEQTIVHDPQQLRQLVSAVLHEPKNAALIGDRLADPDTTDDMRRMLLSAIADTSGLKLHKRWEAPLHAYLVDKHSSLVQPTLKAVRAIKTDRFDRDLKAIAHDTDRPTLVRVTALENLAKRRGALSEDAYRLLTEMLAGSAAPGETAQAAQLIGGASLSTKQLGQLVPLLKHAGPLELRELIKPFARRVDPAVTSEMLKAIGSARSFESLAPHEFSDVIKRYPAELLALANPLLDRLHHLDEQKHVRLDQLQQSLTGGDPVRGAAVFASEKAKCAVCHRLGDKGGKIGPDLSGIGRIRSRRDLLEALIFPSSSFAREYEPFTVVTDAGKLYTGLIVQETDAAVFVQQQVGDPVRIAREAIDEIVPSRVSVMPQGLDKDLSHQQLADLMAYLLSQNGKPTLNDEDSARSE